MFSSLLAKFSQMLKPQPENATATEYLNYLKASYPNNHNYKVKDGHLTPTRELAKRYKRVSELFPETMTSFLDVGSCKGFFVFAASEKPECERSLGIDVYQYDIDVCNWLKGYIHNDKAQFQFMRLHELAERIDEFGGPFQTVLILNLYQYLYFGSDRCPESYLSHDDIFKSLRKVCNGRIIFNNRVNLADCQNVSQVERATEHSLNYAEDKIMAAAAKYFKVVSRGHFGQYPLWTLDVEATTAANLSSAELKEVYEAWASDLTFRESFKKNPENALAQAGFHFDAEKLQRVKSLLRQQDSKILNEELGKRINR